MNREIPFAGHPNVGTAFVLGRLGSVFGKAAGDAMRFEEGAGLVEVALLRREGIVDGASIRAPRDLQLGDEIDAATIASCASLRPDDIATDRHRPVVASVGLPFVIAELRSVESLGRAKPNAAAFSEYAGRTLATSTVSGPRRGRQIFPTALKQRSRTRRPRTKERRSDSFEVV